MKETDERVRRALDDWLDQPTETSAAEARQILKSRIGRLPSPRKDRLAAYWIPRIAMAAAVVALVISLVGRHRSESNPPLAPPEMAIERTLVAVPLASGSVLYIPLDQESS